MHTEVIKAATIDEAVNRILEELKEEDGSDWHNVIYFDGWDGLGASAVLRAIGRRLSAGPEFSQIIHIDCSKWESRRAMQRALAVQLKLPAQVLGMFDAQDEEDDYQGVSKGSRLEIPKIAREIYEHIQKQLDQRFLVIFNNGSSEEIDLESFGFPLSGYTRNKALWSFQGGFRLYPRMKVDKALESSRASSTDVVLSAASSNINLNKFSDILRHEAEEVAKGMINIGGIDWPEAAANCFHYTMRLCGLGGHLIDYDQATHGCNYWLCDGIIKLQEGAAGMDDDFAADTLWLSCDALKHEMRLDADYHQSPQSPASPVVRRLQERMAYWTSPAHGSMLLNNGLVPEGMFQQYDKLCVLKLSACTFSLASPPFLCCHNLRFLWLDHCREDESSRKDGAGNEENIRRCFQRLWVLDVRYSSSKFLSEKMMGFMAQLRELHVMGQEEFDMDTLQGRVHNIRKVRVTKSKTNCSKGKYLFSGKDKMEILELSGNGGSMKSLSVESSSCSSLETVIVEESVGLEEISLKGWTKPNNLLLNGSFPDLHSLDLTGAAVKTLDLSAVTAPKLDKLFLLDCTKLTAILWPALPPPAESKGRGKRYLSKLCIDTTQKMEDDTGSSSRSSAECGWYICVRDARLLGSLEPVKDYFGDNDEHLDISTTMSSPLPTAGRSKDVIGNKSGSVLQAEVDLQKLLHTSKDNNPTTADATTTIKADNGDPDDDESAIMSTCPPAPLVSPQGCYIHIEDQQTTKAATLQADAAGLITVPGFICDGAKTLHMHSSLFITRLLPAPSGSTWNQLEWCRVEQCPKLEGILFSGERSGRRSRGSDTAFGKLRTIWASHLLNARDVWVRSGPTPTGAFKDLTLLHLYCCPRLTSAFSLSGMDFHSLETLEIMWCGDLRVIFHSPTPLMLGLRPEKLVFPKLKRIHLHELPKLHHIWGPYYDSVPMFAPMLETVKIRGCWNIRRLPSKMHLLDDSVPMFAPTPSGRYGFLLSSGRVRCDCEKEWWDMLEWDYKTRTRYPSPTLGYRKDLDLIFGLSKAQDLFSKSKAQYHPTHPKYYKKSTLRGSHLR